MEISLTPEPPLRSSCLMLSAMMSMQERLGRVMKTTFSVVMGERGPGERGNIFST